MQLFKHILPEFRKTEVTADGTELALRDKVSKVLLASMPAKELKDMLTRGEFYSESNILNHPFAHQVFYNKAYHVQNQAPKLPEVAPT